jgi:hypothetical protein
MTARGSTALALAVDLREMRADHLQCTLDVGHVHRPAAVGDGRQAFGRAAQRVHMVDQAPHHRRRGEERRFAPVRCQRHHFGRVEPARCRHHVDPAVLHVRQVVQAAAMRQRCRVQHHVARRHGLHLAQVAQARQQQLARTEHHAFGAAGGAAGVEEPRRIGVAALGGQRQRRCVVRQSERVAVQRHCGSGRDQIAALRVIYESQPRAAVLQDPRRFAGMQLGVDRHRGRTGPPHAPQQHEVVGPVGEEKPDALARQHAVLGEPQRHLRGAARELCVGAPGLTPVADGGARAMALRGA